MSSPAEFALGLLHRARDDAYVVAQLVPEWSEAVLAGVSKPEAESP